MSLCLVSHFSFCYTECHAEYFYADCNYDEYRGITITACISALVIYCCKFLTALGPTENMACSEVFSKNIILSKQTGK